MFELIQKGGLLMWPLLLASVLSITFCVERLIFFRREDLKTPHFLSGIINLIRRRQYAEALDRCDEAHGPVAQVVYAAIKHNHLQKPELKEFVQEVAQLQVPRLEQNLPILATIGYLSPLLGLLGTVTGMIHAFMQMQVRMGTATAGDLAGGIWESLITTAAGLVVAIPTYAAYNYFVARMNQIVRDMERAGTEVVQAITEKSSIIDFQESFTTKNENGGSVPQTQNKG